MGTFRTFGILLTRFFLSSVFLASAMGKVLHWQDQERNLYVVLSEWQSQMFFWDMAQEGFSYLVNWTPLVLLVSIILEFSGGLMILLGIKEKMGAFLLICFLVPATVIMHQFWFVEGFQQEIQIAHFLKNLAILGGLLLILINGAGKIGKQSSFSDIKFG